MPYTAPTVNYATTQNGTYTTLTGVQSVHIVRGRTYFQDNFQASSCTIELIPAASYSTPLAIGQYIDVRVTNTDTARAYFCGKITDIRRSYDIPYNASTGLAPGDRIIISATGGTGLTAAYTFQASVPSGNTIAAAECTSQMGLICTLAGVVLVPNVGSNLTSSTITLPGQNALDLVNKIARTAQYFIDDRDNQRDNVGVLAGQVGMIVGPPTTTSATFSDTGPIRYTGLEFFSSAENVFNQINVYPDGLATQSQTGTAPFNSLDYYTTNNTTADAASLAGLLYNLFNGLTTAVPFTLTTDTNADDTWLGVAQLQTPTGGAGYIAAGATITFRGATYNAQIQRIAVSFTPDVARLALTLSPNLGTPFTLNSNQFGILDTNRLGYP
jgi:hypothetical protein